MNSQHVMSRNEGTIPAFERRAVMRKLTVLISVLLLGACTAMMVGGNTPGGNRAATDGRSPSVVAADSAITTRIKGNYLADSTVSVFSIGVRTWQGTVILSGTVGSFVARDKAESIARGTGGVKAVNNHIVVEDRSADN